MSPNSPPRPLPLWVKIFLGILLIPWFALGVILILICFGYFTDIIGFPPMGIFIPFTIIYNGIIVLFLLLFIAMKRRQSRLAEQIPRTDSPSTSSTPFFDSNRMEHPSLPPEILLQIRRAKLLAFWLPLGVLFSIMVYIWVTLFQEASSIEHVFTTFSGELIFGIILTVIFLIGSGILSKRLQRLKENPDYRPFKLINS